LQTAQRGAPRSIGPTLLRLPHAGHVTIAIDEIVGPRRAAAVRRLTARGASSTILRMPQAAGDLTVSVRLGARLGPGHRTVRLASGATISDLLAALSPELDLDPRQLDGVAVAIAGEVVGHSRALADGEAVVLVLPVAGG
jgi:sulfur carrier protein ThiS